jgi:DNA-binding CsgD family transcriptional regulator
VSLLELGRLDEADDVLADGVSRPLDDSNKYDYGLHARLLRLRGRIDDAARIGASVSDLFGRNAPEIDIPLTVEEAELALARGEPELVTPLVTSAYERSAGSSEEWQLAQLAWLGARAGADLAVRSRGSGRPDRAAQAVAAIERLVAGLPAAAQQPGPEGLGVVVRGFGAALAAENARAGGFDATDLWRQALTVWRELDRPVYALYCGFRLAEALAESGAVTEAQTVLEATDQEAATIGLRPLSDELAVLARRYRLRVGCYPASDGPLTARETEILALIAAGRSNQQIGSELYLSPSTVRVHVSNILRKLQAATRAEAAAIAYQRGLLP